METYRIENLSFSYPKSQNYAIYGIDLTVSPGQWVTLCGKSGCGKTTLLRQLKGSIAPGGDRQGSILFEGKALESLSQREQAAKIGFVMQNPENQIVTDKVWHELAFGLESLGLDRDTIRLRCAEMASFFGIQSWFYSDTASLSGGQKQLLNLASVMAMQPSVLLLDEPTSQLDPIAASDFLTAVKRINTELGVTVIISEHRLEDVFLMSDTVIVMDGGTIAACGTPSEISEHLRNSHHGMFKSLPTPMRIHAGVDNNLPCPITVRDGKLWLDAFAETHPICATAPKKAHAPAGQTLLELDRVWFRYEKQAKDVLRGASLTLNSGSIFSLVGGNGVGKSTLLALAAGLYKPTQGRIVSRATVGFLPQNPQTMFLRDTLRADLEDIGDSSQVSSLCGLDELLDRHPYDLSGGEMQRAALAKVLLTRPDILLLDEPTKGMDAEFKESLENILITLRNQGKAILIVSHDVEFCAEISDTCAMMFDGEIVSMGTPDEFFSGNSFYTTAANRMSRHLIPNAVCAKDVIACCGGSLPCEEKASAQPVKKSTSLSESPTPVEKKRTSAASIIAACLCLLLVPLTIWLGIKLFNDRQYTYISIAVILELMVPFFLIFEGRRPRAREIVLIAALCAIGVIGRMAFFWSPQFKPLAALIIISGVALGAETGFLIGALTAFASNIFYGQGPWTLWQMFAFGLIGFFAGLILYGKKSGKKKLPICIFGGLAVLIIYGGILNPAAEIMFQGYLTWEMLIMSYVRGFPYDLIHAAGTVVFLWIAAKPMLNKLERIKKKYGIRQ